MTERFREVADALPDVPALVSVEGSYTFAEANARSERIGAALGGEDDAASPVAVLLPQTADGLLGILGALKSGRPVVLLDPTLPDEKLHRIVAQAGATVCLTDEGDRVPLRTISPAEALTTGSPAEALTTGPGDARVDRAGREAAFICFTSGSTGRPKGVVLTHDMLLNEAYGGRDRLGVDAGDRVALVLPAAFMAGLTVFVFALLNGAGLYAYDPRVRGMRNMAAWLRSVQVTTLHCTPSLLRSLLAVLAPDERLTGLRLVTTCGEAIHGRDVTALRPHLPADCVYTSWSGSSEIGHLAFFPIPPGDPVPEGIVPVGFPAPGKQVTIVAENGEPVPAGQTGEVVVTSEYLSGGYWDAPDETAARFSGTVYRTGDLGRFDDRGVLHLMGRRDSAVKIRGYLVEPAEVEAALLTAPVIAEAVVVPVQQGSQPVHLAAYVAPHPTAGTPAPATLRRFLRERLPSWMVPTAIVVLPSLPRNERGKVDRVALPPPPENDAGLPPRSHWEVIVADLWAQVLDLESVGVHDDFMALGGDSLAVEELLAAVEERLRLRLTSADLVAAPTVAEFARLVSQARPAGRHPTLVTLRANGEREPIFCFAGAGGLGFSFLPLARRLPGDRPVHALQAYGLENRGLPDWSVGRAARRHLATIRKLQPRGPYHLVGHSLGGLIALDVAHRLVALGEEVSLVAVLDTYLPKLAKEMTFAGPVGRPELVPVKRPKGGLLARLRGDSRELWSYRMRLPLAGVVPFDGITQYGVFFEQGHLLTRLHRVRPWAGRSLLFLAEEHPGDPAAWGGVLTGDLDIHRVGCDHPSVLREPHVESVASAIAKAL
ncbi:alpha/beta fold hydrolase [Micromonospora craniellae]|uniref:alpha/beta fold hydrolase n=1 Tax=Micromonospora craniellae TaxID=2294034 RepID=UPI0013141128|nr:alpha/beta fold hydrolase [Micromonospora craniellae]QOC90142.1 alpha/beta fold hydrolase [Micromonospora craniellae]